MSETFRPEERAVLGIVQADLPDSLAPYADIASQCGLTESEVLALLRRLKARGAIRRFGASIRHQKSGWTHNAMVAWAAPECALEDCGRAATQYQQISHVYVRPSRAPDWPYNFYTMIHGKSEEDCLRIVQELRENSPLKTYIVLRTVRELKKISMTYFA